MPAREGCEIQHYKKYNYLVLFFLYTGVVSLFLSIITFLLSFSFSLSNLLRLTKKQFERNVITRTAKRFKKRGGGVEWIEMSSMNCCNWDII